MPDVAKLQDELLRLKTENKVYRKGVETLALRVRAALDIAKNGPLQVPSAAVISEMVKVLEGK